MAGGAQAKMSTTLFMRGVGLWPTKPFVAREKKPLVPRVHHMEPDIACEQAFGRARLGVGKAKRPVDKHLEPPFHPPAVHQILMQAPIDENTDC